MTREPDVTIIVPGFNVAPWAEDALDSLRAQTHPHWRALLVDDASTDTTGEIFAAAARDDVRFTVLSQATRRGLGAARNVALAHISTPFVGFLDADDVMLPGTLERMLGVLQRSGSDFVVGAYVRLRPDAAGGYTAGDVQPWVAAATAPERIGTTVEAHPDATGNIVAWSKLSRAEVWRELRFPEGRLYEDQVIAQRMYAAASAFDVIPDVVVQWRERADGSSITQREASLPVLIDCLDAMQAGLDVLRSAGLTRATAARVSLIEHMDIPRLSRIADIHPDAAYRDALDTFTARLHG